MDKPTRMFARDATTHPQTAATGPPYTYAVGKPPALQRKSAGHHVRVSPSLCVCHRVRACDQACTRNSTACQGLILTPVHIAEACGFSHFRYEM